MTFTGENNSIDMKIRLLLLFFLAISAVHAYALESASFQIEQIQKNTITIRADGTDKPRECSK
jgi:uncharacterized membrane protein